nr:helix-turn-helix transcriptional regulator [Sphingomonas sp. Y57]
MSLAQRMADRMRELGMSQSELARRVKVSQPTISAIVKGDTTLPKDLRKIALVLETSESWLLGETDDPAAGAIGTSDRDTLAETLGLFFVPDMDIGLAMGAGTFLEVFEQRGAVAFERNFLREISEGNFELLWMARGDGDSMEPTIRDGDAVLIDGAQRMINRPDKIWALTYGGLGMIKRVRTLPDGNYAIMSDNKAVDPITASPSEVHFLGRVVWIGRRQ